MAENSKIEWTDSSWNPIRAQRKDTGQVGWHCERVSPACTNCYAAAFNRRAMPVCGTGLDYTVPMREMVDVFVDQKELLKPLSWKRGRKVFVCSMTDLFADFVPFAAICDVFSIMALAKQHTFQVLTKRPQRAQQLAESIDNYLPGEVALRTGRPGRFFPTANLPWNAESARWPLPNVWLGTTVEDQQRADERIPHLLRTPAAKRFLSVEPMLGPVDLTRIEFRKATWYDALQDHDGFGLLGAEHMAIDWVICGGESGRNARPMHPDWARSLRDQCKAACVPFFFKQWGEYWPLSRTDGIHELPFGSYNVDSRFGFIKRGKHAAGRLLDGVEHSGFPCS